MGETVSFVAREELAEWLEKRAEAEMKTVSSLVQDIVAEEYHRQRENSPSEGDDDGPDVGSDTGESNDPMERHPDVWYVPDSDKYDFAVRHPSDGDATEYYKTADGARKRILRWYEDAPIDGRENIDPTKI